jgi:chondroitin AC lyase
VTTFAGGVSDGTYGCAAYDFKDGDLRARKSWFYFDREFVCLGAGITCPTDNPILTSINQCLMNGDVVVCDGDGVRAIEKGDRDIVGLRWAHHDGVGYVFPGGQAVHVKNEVQTGDWHDINTYEPPGEVSEDVFSLWLDHGAKPSGATYGYIVVPGIDADTMESYAANDIVVLSNAPQLQAARHRGLKIIGAAFYEPGVLNMDNGHTMAVDKPCLVLVREMGSEIELAVSNPDNEPLDLSVEISVQLTGDGCVWDPDKGATNIRVALPGGEMAGGSVIRKVRPAAG